MFYVLFIRSLTLMKSAICFIKTVMVWFDQN